jgi:hypothetical protein
MAMMTAGKTWVQPGMGPAEYERDMAQCRYEASIYGYTPHVRRYYRDWGDALGDSIGQAIVIEARRAELTTACMQARGWRLVDSQVYAKQPSTLPPAAPQNPNPPATSTLQPSILSTSTQDPHTPPEALGIDLRPETPGIIQRKYYSEPMPRDKYQGSMRYEDYVDNTERWKSQMRQQYGQW